MPKELQCEVFRLPTACHQRGNPETSQIVAAYVPYQRRGQPVRPTMLFSHGNAVDLGQMMPFYKCAGILFKRLHCHWSPTWAVPLLDHVDVQTAKTMMRIKTYALAGALACIPAH